MKVTLLTIGKWKGAEIASLFAFYATRCKPKLELIELELPARELKGGAIKEKEAVILLSRLPNTGTIIACDEHGETFDSRGFAAMLGTQLDKRGPQLTFIIGGADGLHETVLAKAHAKLSLGRLTWPHLLVRVLLAEQIYRAQSIRAGHPYHRD